MAATKRVLLTGASGFVARHAQQRLLELGYEVHAVGFRATTAWAHRNVHVHTIDLLDERQSATLLRSVRPTHLMHLAWYAVPGKFWTSPDNLRWVSASLNLTHAFVEAGGTRAIYSGTCAEYDWSSGRCREDTTPLRPTTLYGTCKHALHSVLAQAADDMGLSVAWGRLFFVYGSYEADRRLVSSVITSLLKGEPTPCTHGRQVRDFMHVQDVADAMAALLDSPVTGPVNIASGDPRPVADVVRLIGDATGRSELVRWGARQPQPDEPERIEADVARLTDEVGFRPRLGLEEGIYQTVAWWRERLRAQSE